MTKMQKNKLLSFILCFVLIAAMALGTSGCNNGGTENAPDVNQTAETDATVLKEFSFTSVDPDGNETTVTVQTEKEFVGEALLEEGLISGEDGPYGLYVKTVNGVTLDYETDGQYWAFYVDGEYANSGVDKTPIVHGAAYAFKAE